MSEHTHIGKVVHLATDHAGFAHKNAIKEWLRAQGLEITDHGANTLDPLDDFTDYIAPAAKAVSENPNTSVGIIFGGSGQGEAMAANRFTNVRATVYYGGDSKIITLSREHNDANVLSIGARFVDVDLCKKVITAWLQHAFAGETKRIRRNKKLEQIQTYE